MSIPGLLQVLPVLARLHPKNKKHNDYPQLWYVMPFQKWNVKRQRFSVLRRLPHGICGILTGHEFSRTETGFDGGRFINKWCRWCNKMFEIPTNEEPEIHGFLGEIFKMETAE